jgi:protein involved in ribonucleotide reduction
MSARVIVVASSDPVLNPDQMSDWIAPTSQRGNIATSVASGSMRWRLRYASAASVA